MSARETLSWLIKFKIVSFSSKNFIFFTYLKPDKLNAITVPNARNKKTLDFRRFINADFRHPCQNDRLCVKMTALT